MNLGTQGDRQDVSGPLRAISRMRFAAAEVPARVPAEALHIPSSNCRREPRATTPVTLDEAVAWLPFGSKMPSATPTPPGFTDALQMAQETLRWQERHDRGAPLLLPRVARKSSTAHALSEPAPCAAGTESATRSSPGNETGLRLTTNRRRPARPAGTQPP
jgi:hypothetical protein